MVTERFLAENTVLITLNVEPKNALNLEALKSLVEVFDRCEQNPLVDIIILTGSERAFCTGLNLDTMRRVLDSEVIETLYNCDLLLYKLVTSAKFLVSAINGHAVGSGAVLALATDYRIINDNEYVKIGFPEYPNGLFLPALMRAIVKRAGLKDAGMLLMGELINHDRAKKLGLVDDTYDGDVSIKLYRLCEKLNGAKFNYKLYKQHFVSREGFLPPKRDDAEYKIIVEMIQSRY
jgi:enoyl-CoA hydratase/carnithine racemase